MACCSSGRIFGEQLSIFTTEDKRKEEIRSMTIHAKTKKKEKERLKEKEKRKEDKGR